MLEVLKSSGNVQKYLGFSTRCEWSEFASGAGYQPIKGYPVAQEQTFRMFQDLFLLMIFWSFTERKAIAAQTELLQMWQFLHIYLDTHIIYADSQAHTYRYVNVSDQTSIFTHETKMLIGYVGNVFIGPESDHWLCLSVTHWLTDWLRESLNEKKSFLSGIARIT